MVINIENNLSEGDNNKKDDNKEKEAKENPIGINIGKEEELIALIKTKFKAFWHKFIK